MKGRVGKQLGLYGSILPGAVRLAKVQKASKRARTRLKWIDYYLANKNGRLTCRHFDLPPSLFYKWLKRFQRLGIKGLESRSTRPKHFRQSEIPLEDVDLVKRLRRENPEFSKYKLQVILKRDFDVLLSASSIGRIIKKYDLFFKNPIKSKKERQKLSRNKLPQDFKLANPGDLVEQDTKHVPFMGRKSYFFVVTDCLTKITSIKVGTNISSRQARKAFEKARQNFPYEIKNVQNDNGSENLKELTAYLGQEKISQYFTRPRTPKDNAFVERMIGTIEREFIQQGNLAQDVRQQQELIDCWLKKYHTYRPHQALNYLTPYEYYEKLKQEKCPRCYGP